MDFDVILRIVTDNGPDNPAHLGIVRVNDIDVVALFETQRITVVEAYMLWRSGCVLCPLTHVLTI